MHEMNAMNAMNELTFMFCDHIMHMCIYNTVLPQWICLILVLNFVASVGIAISHEPFQLILFKTFIVSFMLV